MGVSDSAIRGPTQPDSTCHMEGLLSGRQDWADGKGQGGVQLPRGQLSGADFSWVSLSRKPSQRPVGTHWKWDAPEKANPEPLAPDLASPEGSEQSKGNVGQGKNTALGVQRLTLSGRLACPHGE